jgi:hypothetical protein
LQIQLKNEKEKFRFQVNDERERKNCVVECELQLNNISESSLQWNLGIIIEIFRNHYHKPQVPRKFSYRISYQEQKEMEEIRVFFER